jgi:hypothetical protein
MIISLGLSFYNVINMIESSSNNIFDEIADLDKNAVDEGLEIQSVKLTVTNSLNLTIKNTGSVLSSLKWIGVFDDTLNTQEYYSVDTRLNPVETQKEIGNSSISLNPSNTYTIQVLTELGNIYYSEYPEPSAGGGSGGGNTTSPYYSDYESSDLHADTAIGSHSLFGAMKAGPDVVLNTLSEELSGSGEANQTLLDNESFEGTWLPSGWTEVPGNSRWNRESNVVYDGSWSADFDGGGGGFSGSLVSPILDCSNAKFIYVNFWYYDDALDAGEFELEYYDGSSWDLIADLGINAEVTWHNYQHNISDSQYMNSNFQIRWSVTTAQNGEHAYVDLVNVIKTAPLQSYELDLEVLWSDLSSFNNGYLLVYGVTQGTEALQVDVWDGIQWVTVISDIQAGWNTVDVSSYLSGSTFSIRFKDTVQTSDATQDSWEIDALVLNLFD